jgi:hypothetical protein
MILRMNLAILTFTIGIGKPIAMMMTSMCLGHQCKEFPKSLSSLMAEIMHVFSSI